MAPLSELFNRYCMVSIEKPIVEYKKEGNQFICEITIDSISLIGFGRSQKIAKEDCLKSWFDRHPEIFSVETKAEKKSNLPTIEEACINTELTVRTEGNKLILSTGNKSAICYSRDCIWETLIALTNE